MISTECMEYISTDASNHAEVDQTIVEVSLSAHSWHCPRVT